MHMRTIYRHLSVLCLALVTPSLVMAEIDVQRPILCAIRDVADCGADYACIEVKPDDVALPDFFEIDLGNKVISSVGSVNVGVSPIKLVDRVNGKLILQGGDERGDNLRGAVGWTLTVNENSGKVVIAGVSDEFALVAFGSCVQK